MLIWQTAASHTSLSMVLWLEARSTLAIYHLKSLCAFGSVVQYGGFLVTTHQNTSYVSLINMNQYNDHGERSLVTPGSP
jgi:hypothetical protein